MARKYSSYSPEKKLRVALEAARNEKTVSQIASEHGIHPCQVSDWKRQLLSEGAEIFRSKRTRQDRDGRQDVEYLQQQIGKLTVEVEWLKKKHGLA